MPEDAGHAPALEITSSRHLAGWLVEQSISLAFTTYQAGKLFLVGVQPDGRLAIFERSFHRCMGLWSDGQSLLMSTLYQLWRFENALAAGQAHEGHDRLYVPQVAYTTGNLDIHDVAVDANGRIVFVNTLFSCLATVSERASFAPVWRPPWIARLAPEDRCHLNGLALRDGAPRYASSVSRADVADGWRDRRRDGGVVVDLDTGETVLEGLSMPHSPRWHEGDLWLLDSGRGRLVRADPVAGTAQDVAFCPGYLRGLALCGRFAVVGLSLPRDNQAFRGLELDAELDRRGASARCGLAVVDLASGDTVHWLRLDGVVRELYDVAVLAGVRRPMALGLRGQAIERYITIG